MISKITKVTVLSLVLNLFGFLFTKIGYSDPAFFFFIGYVSGILVFMYATKD